MTKFSIATTELKIMLQTMQNPLFELGTSLRVEFTTTLGFVDDGLFVQDPTNHVFQVRSASRLGYWNLDKNRRRMEEIRKDFLK